ncbi:sigma factor-like helix-turn-helix DNA-binding protein [Streptomyces sp. NPDC006173]|uniref:RNA polymerase sigma factor n=1 Tax=Streptomyces sp. NPDC006173 TaxID=3155349 RepID=UPI0033E6B450
MRRVLALVVWLPPRQRQVFAYCLDGFAPREISEVLGLEEAAVRSHIRHSRERLRTLLTGSPPVIKDRSQI